jgi:drug/metabolite transporter (DMT)-like permease
MHGPRDTLDGIGLRLLAAFLITAMSAAVHQLASDIPVGQIIFWRSAVAVGMICLYMALRREFPVAILTARPLAHVTRSAFGALSMVCSFVSLAYLSVANAQALAYLAPVLTLPLAALLIGERLTGRVMLATALGFGGVVAMLWQALSLPGSGAVVGVAAGLGYAVTVAFVRIHIKAMTGTERASTIAFWFAVTCTAVGLASWPFGWATPTGAQLGWLIATGLLGGMAHIAATEATARAPVSVLAPFDYTGMVWALGFDMVLFRAVPGPMGLAGVAAILAASLLVTLAPRRTVPQP